MAWSYSCIDDRRTKPRMDQSSNQTFNFRCAPEHVRKLSDDERLGTRESVTESAHLPERAGDGVFRLQQLSDEVPQETDARTNREPDIVMQEPPQRPNETQEDVATSPERTPQNQPDAEPLN